MADSHSIPESRICTKCGVEKPLLEFTKATRGKYGRSARCRACAAAYARANRDLINELSLARYHRLQEPKRAAKLAARLRRIESSTKRCAGCRQIKDKSEFGAAKQYMDGLKTRCKRCHNSYNKSVREAHPESAREWSTRWRSKNREHVRERFRRWRSRPENRIHLAVGARIYASLLYGKMGLRTEEILGYSFIELREHLERQFTNGMSWDNYGDWHIDHIVPLVSFKVESVGDPAIRAAWALTNLRPLWALENLRKNRKRIYLI